MLSSAEKFLEILTQVRSFQSVNTSRDEPGQPVTNDCNGESASRSSSPIVVHCSAGIGRTGTFLAIDISLRELEATGTVNIQKAVEKIRRQRAFCIQTEEQYAFCYAAVLEYALQQKRENGECLDKVEQCLTEWQRETTRYR